MKRGRFSGNNSPMGVTVLANSTLAMQDTYVMENSVDKGAVYASPGSVVHLDNVHITGNNASGYGAALYSANADVTVQGNSNMSWNKAREAGGAVFAEIGSILVLRDSHLVGNAAGLHTSQCGGAVCVQDTRLTISGCTFTNNTAGYCGGALHINNQLANSQKPPLVPHFTPCAPQTIHWQALVYSSQFEGNMAAAGGAVVVYSASMLVDNTTFAGNKAQSMFPTNDGNYYARGVGGAVYADNANVTVHNSTMRANHAVMDGGACVACAFRHVHLKAAVVQSAWQQGC